MKKQVSMIGSVPLSLNEMQLAPAMLGAIVRNKGHRYQYLDINLELFYACDKQQDLYIEHTEFLQDIIAYRDSNPTIDAWQQSILDRFSTTDILLVNVFSVPSQGAAWRFVYHVRKQYPTIKILIGGIGSHKRIFGSINEHNQQWIKETFPRCETKIFGQILLDNNWVDGWQQDVGTDVLEANLPLLPSDGQNRLVDFSEYKIDNYCWEYDKRSIPMLGSHGCVRQCSFCDVIVHFPKYNFIEADQLSKNIVEVYSQTGIGKIQFMDSLVNGSMSNFLSLLKNLTHAKKQNWLPQDFSWSGTYICRPSSTMLKEIHSYLGSSGADTMVIGVESGSDRVRFEMEKKFTNSDLLHELEAFNQVGVKASLLFFPAWPTETIADFDQTLELFENLATWSHRGTIDSINLGVNGFTLIDNTPIDKNKDAIGLIAGPATFLWKCHTNPTLDYWESLRRRRLMSKWAHSLGISCANEAFFIRNLIFSLEKHRDAITNWTRYWNPGLLTVDLDDHLWSKTSNSNLKLRLINSGSTKVDVELRYGQTVHDLLVEPGVTEFEIDLRRPDRQSIDFQMKFRFAKDYDPQIDCYDSGDYYSKNGIYIDLVMIDSRDITMYGFNQMMKQRWVLDNEFLPADYRQHQNFRAVIADCDLISEIKANVSLHEHISRCQVPATWQELDFLDEKLSIMN
jgi:hypothetical protein